MKRETPFKPNIRYFQSLTSILLLTILACLLVLPISQSFALTNFVITTIPTPNDPFNLTVNPVNGFIYVTEPPTDSVSVIESNNNEVIDTISVCDHPWGIAYNPLNDYVYVSCQSGKILSVIDSNTNQIVDTIIVSSNPVGGGSPTGIAINPDNGYVYATVSFLDAVAVIDGDTNDIIQTIPVEDSPWSISFNPYNNLVYVGNFNSGTISVIDSNTNEIVKDVAVGPNPRESTINPTNGKIYVAIESANSVSVIDGNTNEVIDNIEVGMQPIGIVFNPSNYYIYVANAEINADPHTVSVIDGNTNEVIESVIIEQLSEVGLALPLGLMFNPINDYVYLATAGAQLVYVISSSPSDTVITSATDGNGFPINNEGSTLSNGITFTFESTSTNSAYECSLDNKVFSNCFSPQTYNNLNSGTHTFQVASLGDPTPAHFTWTVLTFSEAINKLIDSVKNLNDIDFRVKFHLLRLASSFSNDRNSSDGLITCTVANAFTSLVNTFVSRGFLSPTQADDLNQQTQAIENWIGCNTHHTSSVTSSHYTKPNELQQMQPSNTADDGRTSTEQTKTINLGRQ